MSHRRRRGARCLVALGAAAVLGLGLAGCGDDEPRVTVGLMTKQEADPFWGDDARGRAGHGG
jgi:ABC-type sugar transport system substrate-binding protein